MASSTNQSSFIPQCSEECSLLAETYFPSCVSKCHCGKEDSTISFFPIIDPYGTIVPSCNDCIEKTMAILDAKRREALTFIIESPQYISISLKRSNGTIEGGFSPQLLKYSSTERNWFIKTMKRCEYDEIHRGVYVKDVLSYNPGLKLTLMKNRFAEGELIEEINRIAGGPLFRMLD